MTATTSLQSIADSISNATSYSQIFGPTLRIYATKDAMRAELAPRFAALLRVVHPDHAAPEDKAAAEKAFRLVIALRRHALAAIERGDFSKPFRPGSITDEAAAANRCVIRSASDTIFVDDDPAWAGDFSAIYQGRSAITDRDFVIKIARHPFDNGLLEREAFILGRMYKEKPLETLTEFVPRVIDSFTMPGEKGQRFRVNVMDRRDGYVSLVDIVSRYPGGLPAQDAAWVFRRILAQVQLARIIGVVHSAIVPDHILVHPTTHDPMHIGWAHAIDVSPSARVPFVLTRWKSFYPEEVMNKSLVDHRTDLYMAAKCMQYVVGKNHLPSSVDVVISGCLKEKMSRRPSSTREVMDVLTSAIRSEWGKEYRALVMAH